MGEDESESDRLRSDPSVRPRHAVITALAEALNTEPTDLKPNLYEKIELEALDTLLLHRRDADVSITFSLLDRTVTVWIDDEDYVIVEIKNRDV